MTRIIIEGLRNRESLINAIAVVLQTFNCDEAYAEEEHVFVPVSREVEAPDAPSADRHLEPDPGRRVKSHRGPTPFVPCPRRGTHERLLDCWMCWCDVMRGAALEPEVLSLHAWAAGPDCRG